MEFRKLGRTNLQVSLVGLGTGGMNRLGQARNRSREDMHRFVHQALDRGINIIDTAPAYLESEALLGEALAGVPRDSYVMCTKLRGGQPGDIRRSLEASLRKLQTDHVDVTYFHGVTPGAYKTTVSDHLAELKKAQADGLTRFVGVTELYEVDPSHEALQMVVEDGHFDVVMVGFNMLTPTALQRVLPLAHKNDIGVVVMCAVRTVITTPQLLHDHIRDWKAEGALPQDAVPDDAPLDWVLGPGVATVADAAYKFAAEPPAVSSVLTGTADLSHLDANIAAMLGPALPPDTSKRLIDIFTPVNKSVQAGIGGGRRR